MLYIKIIKDLINLSLVQEIKPGYTNQNKIVHYTIIFSNGTTKMIEISDYALIVKRLEETNVLPK